MFRLLPRDENFFDLFEQQAGHIVSASRVLEELTLDYPAAQAKVERIRDLEHAGDAITLACGRRKLEAGADIGLDIELHPMQLAELHSHEEG